MASLHSNKNFKVSFEQCLCVDDMARAGYLLYNGPGVLLASLEVHSTK